MLAVPDQPKNRAIVWMLAASLLLHVCLTPLPALFGWMAMLPALSVPDDADLIEIELTSLPIAAPAPEPKSPEKVEPAQAEAPAKPSEPSEQPPRTEPPEPGDDPPKAAPDAVAPAPEAREKAPNEQLYADPLALAGSAASIVDSNANVRLFIYADVIRNHPLGPRVGTLLKRTPQWSDFFGVADIDPIRDVDRVLIAGPQLRNSSQVVGVVQHHLPRTQIEAALQQLVDRKGEWIDKQARLARAEADRATRLFSAPNDTVVVVAPPQLEKQLASLGEKSRFPEGSGDIALSAYVVTPHRVTRGTGLKLPESIKWARFDLRPTPDGGGILKILAQDSDAETARANAEFFQMMIDQIATVDLRRGGGLGAFASMLLGSEKVRMLEEAKFSAKGKRIEGTIVATRAQLMNVADLLEAFLPPPIERSRSSPARSTIQENSPDEPASQDGDGRSLPPDGASPRSGE